MTNRERFLNVLHDRKADRLPVIEWASWWDQTVRNWIAEDKNVPGDQHALFHHWGLDDIYQFWVTPKSHLLQPTGHGGAIISDLEEYESKLNLLYPQSHLDDLRKGLLSIKEKHDRGEIAVWFTLEGFFWFPRVLLGIENHLYAFYDDPELMHKINTDLLAYNLKIIDVIYDVLTPEFMTFAEDMSYNLGPMLSKEFYDEFMAPYYNGIVDKIKSYGTKVLIDTDGNVEPLIPWFKECGIEGCLPLERMAGVDVNRIRENHPDWIMIGGFDKTTMHLGEDAMRAEFERILPAMRSGRYIPSVDHQTPPDVTVENYKTYVRLLNEYAASV